MDAGGRNTARSLPTRPAPQLSRRRLGERGAEPYDGHRQRRRTSKLGSLASRPASRTAAHRADEGVSGNAMLPAPLLSMLDINRVGQLPHGLIGYLTESRVAQHVNHRLPAVLQGEHLLTEEPLCPAIESAAAVLPVLLQTNASCMMRCWSRLSVPGQSLARSAVRDDPETTAQVHPMVLLADRADRYSGGLAWE